MGRIFLSYAREDRSCAERLARLCEEAGHEVWWDRHLDGGEDFAAQIESELATADVVLVAWSKKSVASRWVRDEAAVGGDSGRLVPVSIDGSRPPMGFRQFHTIDLTGWKASPRDERTAELLHSVQKRLKEEPANGEDRRKTTTKRAAFAIVRSRWGVAALAVLLLGAAIAGYFFANREQEAGTPSRPMLAISPFTSTSSDQALQSLASETRAATAHALSDSGMQIRMTDASVDGDADYVMLGTFSEEPDKIVATIRLDDVRRRASLWSRRFEIVRKDAAILPDRIGAQVAGSLSWAAVLHTLNRQEVPDATLAADLLRTLDLTGDPLESYQISQRLSEKWPQSGMAQLGLAFNTAFVLSQLPLEQRPEAVAAARRASDRAQKLMPHFGDAYVPPCLLQPPTRLAACEDRYRAALLADPDSAFVNGFLAGLFNEVGRRKEALERMRLSYVHDRYVPSKIAFMILLLTVSGDDAGAEKLYRRAIEWWPESGLQQVLLWGLIQRGDFGRIVRQQELFGPSQLDPSYAGLKEIARAADARSVPALRSHCGRNGGHWLEPAECMLAFAKLGELDSAYAFVDRLYPNRVGEPRDEERLWLNNPDVMPLEFLTSRAAAPLRRDQRYLAVARRTGLAAYWRTGLLPDFCETRSEAICASLR